LILSFTGRGSGAAKLASSALAELKGEFVPVLSPERAAQHYLPFVEGSGKAIIFGLGNPSDTLKVAEAFKLTSYDVFLVRPPLEGLPPTLASKLEVYDAKELSPNPLEASFEAGKFALELALEGSEGVRAERIRDDLEDLEFPLQIPEDFEIIAYTESMELAALTLGDLLKKPTVHVQHLPSSKRALILTTSAEEDWARRLAFSSKSKLLSLPYDPLVAPLAFLASLKKLMPYMRADST